MKCLISALLQVCDEFHMDQQAFLLAVSFVDRFLSKVLMPLSGLQLLGTTALFVAFKVEERDTAPGLAKKFLWMTKDTYTVDQVIIIIYHFIKFMK